MFAATSEQQAGLHQFSGLTAFPGVDVSEATGLGFGGLRWYDTLRMVLHRLCGCSLW